MRMDGILGALDALTGHGRALVDLVAVAGGVLAAVRLGRGWIRDALGVTANEARSLENLMYNAGAPMAHRVLAAEQYLASGHGNPVALAWAGRLVEEHGGAAAGRE